MDREVSFANGGSWTHSNGQSIYNYQRSISKGGTGATLKYTCWPARWWWTP
jgi:hypothetical protein